MRGRLGPMGLEGSEWRLDSMDSLSLVSLAVSGLISRWL